MYICFFFIFYYYFHLSSHRDNKARVRLNPCPAISEKINVYVFKETIEKIHHARSPRGLAGKIVKNCPLTEPIRLQDLENSARSQTWKKISNNNQSLLKIEAASNSYQP